MPALPSSRFSITCRPRSPSVPWWAGGCRVRGTGFLLLSYLAYLVLGTGVFWALEGRSTQDRGRNFQRDKWELLQNYTCLDGPALDLLIRGIIQAYKDGTSLLGKSTSMGRWEFVGSFFFSVSTITTIGYGNLSPQTMAARLFCIFFALVGIPFNLVVLNRLGHLMQCGVHRCAHRLGARWQSHGSTLCTAGLCVGTVANRLRCAALRPPVLPVVASASLLPHGGLELCGELLLRLHHSQHRGIRRLCDWYESFSKVPSVVQEHRVSVDPLWDGLAGSNDQTNSVPV
ncbi:potassium channel subfamily K member 17 isoform X2 [Meriones unguiculatus]|uniref:potassium channel subfamily K member 17 isoform X2 n=1 Tax=Meriones unguiculatus TaxID=10047 RepID=UPI00293F56B3|nr:potassium channel subfamily K member 17 isoform X2 [Meriones unguiculatus]